MKVIVQMLKDPSVTREQLLEYAERQVARFDNNVTSRPIRLVTLGIDFGSISEAARWLASSGYSASVAGSCSQLTTKIRGKKVGERFKWRMRSTGEVLEWVLL